MSPSYWKRRKEKLLARSRKGVEARERIRLVPAAAGDHDRDGQGVAGRAARADRQAIEELAGEGQRPEEPALDVAGGGAEGARDRVRNGK